MTKTSLRGRGQVTLPAEVRDALHVREGDDIAFEIQGDVVVMRGLVSIPARERILWENPEIREAVDRGLAQVAAGEIVRSERSFEAFADEPDDE